MSGIFKKLIEYIEAEDIKGIFRYCLILLPFVGGGIWGLLVLVAFVTEHKEALVLVGVAACMIIPAFWGKKGTVQIDQPPISNGSITFFDKLLLRGLFDIFTCYTRQFQIIPPAKFADLHDDLPSGWDFGRNINIYRFKIVSDGEPLEPSLFHELLTSHIEEKLSSGELALGKPVAEFGGQLYPKIFVDECLCASNIWHMSVLICDNEKVANYIANKYQTLVARHSPVSLQYENGDF